MDLSAQHLSVPAALTTAELNATANYRGCVNATPFLGEAPGKLLFRGFTAPAVKREGRFHGSYLFEYFDGVDFVSAELNDLPQIHEAELPPAPEPAPQPEPTDEVNDGSHVQ